MTVRSDFATALKAVLPSNIKIVDVPRSLDGMETGRPVVLFYRDRLEKAPNAQGMYMSTISLWIITPNVDTARAEDNLDATLDVVIGAIDSITWVNWKAAERATFGDAQAPAYRIDLTIATTKE
jgi:hypothetical protein